MGKGFKSLAEEADNEYAMMDGRYRAGTSTQCRGSKKEGNDECIGKSKGGLTTKIHARCDALGNPTGFHLTAGQASDLEGADVLLADKACDADERVLTCAYYASS
jgi:hypothetical protein